MKFSEIYRNSQKPVISFEIFPPKTNKGVERLKRTTLCELKELSPDFITVTYGAMGTTRERTIDIASYIKNSLKIETACHLTCVGSSRDEIDRILASIKENGIRNIVALRGDPPKGENKFITPEGGMSYANELVSHIREFENQNNYKELGIAIAGYPEKHLEAPNLDIDIENLKRKVEAGADIIITQLFFDNSYYFNYLKRVRDADIELPIIPGLMPILSAKQIMKITSLCGTKIPEQLRNELIDAGDNDSLAEEIGIKQCINQAKELLDKGVPGLHFYVLNKASHIKTILESI